MAFVAALVVGIVLGRDWGDGSRAGLDGRRRRRRLTGGRGRRSCGRGDGSRAGLDGRRRLRRLTGGPGGRSCGRRGGRRRGGPAVGEPGRWVHCRRRWRRLRGRHHVGLPQGSRVYLGGGRRATAGGGGTDDGKGLYPALPAAADPGGRTTGWPALELGRGGPSAWAGPGDRATSSTARPAAGTSVAKPTSTRRRRRPGRQPAADNVTAPPRTASDAVGCARGSVKVSARTPAPVGRADGSGWTAASKAAATCASTSGRSRRSGTGRAGSGRRPASAR